MNVTSVSDRTCLLEVSIALVKGLTKQAHSIKVQLNKAEYKQLTLRERRFGR